MSTFLLGSRTVPFLSLSTVAPIFTKRYHFLNVAVDVLRARTFSVPRASKGPPCPQPALSGFRALNLRLAAFGFYPTSPSSVLCEPQRPLRLGVIFPLL